MTRTLRHFLLIITSFFIFGAALCAQRGPENHDQGMRWRMVGPFRGGRTRAVAGVPDQSNIFYIGAVDGGVWKSTDYGRTWNSIFDDQPTQSIGAIAVAPSNPNIVYIASGEGLQRPDLSVGDGIYKSTDAGKTWTHLGLRDGQQIPALAIDSRNPDRVFAAVLGHPYGANRERGIFRSTDGGATWEKVLYKDEKTGGSNVEIDPSNSNVIYAGLWQSRLGPWEDNNGFEGTHGGLFKSTDGGTTWRKLTNGLPDDAVQINVAISPSQTSRLYATLATTKPTEYASDAGLGFYRSDDGGENWYRVTTDPRPAMKIGGGDLPIARVDPKNADVVYSASLVTVRSIDGGKTWMSLRGAPGGDDYQNLWINPNDPKIILLVADQGALVTVNGGETWSSWYNQPTAQMYHAITTNTFPYKICGGQQESGSVCISSRGNDGAITFRDWHPVGAIEYGYVAPDPLDPDIVYGAGRSEVSRFHWSTGQAENVTPIPVRGKYRTDRTEPIMFSPLDPHLLFYATNILFSTRDRGHTWEPISPDLTREDPGVPNSVGDQAGLNAKAAKQRGAIYALAPSFRDVNTIWAGTDDGLVWITRDRGKNWSNITPPELTPWSKVTQISASHFDDQTAYLSVSRFRVDDLKPYIYRTHDGGKTWQQITSGLPDNAPVNTVRADAQGWEKYLIFAGTENGVWISWDDGNNWQSLQLNLPHASVRDLWIHENDLIVATHGRGFWVLDDIMPLRRLRSGWPALMTSSKPESGEPPRCSLVMFPDPAPAYRVRRDTNTDTPIPPDEPAGENPPDGAILDYFVYRPCPEPVTLEILDSQGKLVRRYSTEDKPDLSPEERAKGLIPPYWLQESHVLSKDPGWHRWVWDLRYPPPVSSEHEYPSAAVPHATPRYPLGPSVLPGNYKARLSAGHQPTVDVPFVVKMDPRVSTSPAGLQKKFELEAQLAEAITESSQAVMQARSAQEQLEDLAASKPAMKEAVESLREKISELLDGAKNAASETDAHPLKNLNRTVIALYKEVEKADSEPAVAQVGASSEMTAKLSPLLKHWEGLKGDLKRLNIRLSAGDLPRIDLDRPPEHQEAGENEE
jgi:photosystem II stability/assembly factor-like uncharacterized protein